MLPCTSRQALYKLKIHRFEWWILLYFFASWIRWKWCLLHRQIWNNSIQCKICWKTKFELKVLVWLVISFKGISASVIRPRGAKAINADIYIDQCLSKLKQLIEMKHSQDEIMFWLDLASSHYAKKHWIGSLNKTFHMYRWKTILQTSHKHVQSKISGLFWNVRFTRRAEKLKTSNSWSEE